MSDSLKGLESLGKRVLKGTSIELYLDLFHSEAVKKLRQILAPIKAEEVPGFIERGEALPVPPSYFRYLRGYEEYLEKVPPKRLFKWIMEARPDIGRILMGFEDQGIDYIIRLKSYIIDSVKASGEPKKEEKEETPESKLVQLHCTECNEDWPVPADEVDQVDHCPFCGSPAKGETNRGS